LYRKMLKWTCKKSPNHDRKQETNVFSLPKTFAFSLVPIWKTARAQVQTRKEKKPVCLAPFFTTNQMLLLDPVAFLCVWDPTLSFFSLLKNKITCVYEFSFWMLPRQIGKICMGKATDF
jgi:hypothetical protein